MKAKYKLLAGVAVIAVIYVFTRGGGSIEGQTIHPQVLPSYVEMVTATGQIRPKQEVFLTLRKGGLVDLVHGTINDPVKKDQILVTVDTRTNRAALERAMSKYRLAGSEHHRNKRLLSSRAGTRQAYDESLNQTNVARTELEEARQRMEDSVARAPFDGVLSFLPFHIGDFVPDGSRVAVVEDRSGAELVTRISQTFAKLFPRDTRVKFLKGDVSEDIDVTISLVDPEQVSGAQDIDIRLLLHALPTKFKFRDFVDVQIPLDAFKNIAVVPAEYIMSASAKPFVYILKDGSKLEKQQLQIASVHNGNYYIKNLSSEDKIFLPFEAKGLEQKVGSKIAIKEKSATVTR